MRSDPIWVYLLFGLVKPFVGHPERIAGVASCWILAAVVQSIWRRKFGWPPWIAGAFWGLFAAWEWYCVRIGADIRVDLFLISPVLLAVTLWGLAGLIIPGLRSQPFRRQFSLRALMIVMTVVAIALGLLMWLVA